jgi:hypothetical protein
MFRLRSSGPGVSDKFYTETVMVDYYPIACVSAQMRFDEAADTADRAPTVSAGFSGKRNQPNVVYAGAEGAPELYTATAIHLYGRIHDIAGLNCDGELVVEHELGNRKLFACFPVTRGAPMVGVHGDPVDTLVNASNPTATRINGSFAELHLSDAVGSRAISYRSVDRRGMPCRVVVFLDVIRTSADISEYANGVRDLFVAKPETAPIVLSVRRRRESAVSSEDDGGGQHSLSSALDLHSVEGFSTTTNADGKNVLVSDGPANDILTCEYLPVSTETVQVFQIPIDTNIVADTAHQEMTSVALYVVMSILFGLGIAFIAPIIYGSGLANYFRHKLPESLNFLNGWFMTSDLTWTDFILVSAMMFLGIVLTSAGLASGKNPLKAGGIVIFVMLFVGFFGIHISAKMGWRDAHSALA